MVRRFHHEEFLRLVNMNEESMLPTAKTRLTFSIIISLMVKSLSFHEAAMACTKENALMMPWIG